jgi:hypothetical protein
MFEHSKMNGSSMPRTRKARRFAQRFAEDQIRADSSVRDDAKEHALKITAAWQKAVTSIIETGRLLVEARKGLPPGCTAPCSLWGEASAPSR